jgi:hypothetical protein
MTIPNDNTIQLFHPSSESTYTFRGRGYIEYKLKASTSKKRMSKAKFKALTKNEVSL